VFQKLKFTDKVLSQTILQRIENKAPNYNRLEWLADRKRNLGYLVNIAQYPTHYLDLLEGEYADAVTEHVKYIPKSRAGHTSTTKPGTRAKTQGLKRPESRGAGPVKAPLSDGVDAGFGDLDAETKETDENMGQQRSGVTPLKAKRAVNIQESKKDVKADRKPASAKEAKPKTAAVAEVKTPRKNHKLSSTIGDKNEKTNKDSSATQAKPINSKKDALQKQPSEATTQALPVLESSPQSAFSATTPSRPKTASAKSRTSQRKEDIPTSSDDATRSSRVSLPALKYAGGAGSVKNSRPASSTSKHAVQLSENAEESANIPERALQPEPEIMVADSFIDSTGDDTTPDATSHTEQENDLPSATDATQATGEDSNELESAKEEPGHVENVAQAEVKPQEQATIEELPSTAEEALASADNQETAIQGEESPAVANDEQTEPTKEEPLGDQTPDNQTAESAKGDSKSEAEEPMENIVHSEDVPKAESKPVSRSVSKAGSKTSLRKSGSRQSLMESIPKSTSHKSLHEGAKTYSKASSRAESRTKLVTESARQSKTELSDRGGETSSSTHELSNLPSLPAA
jgi:hypothetical protein